MKASNASEKLSNAEHYERVQLGLARMCIFVGLAGFASLARDLFAPIETIGAWGVPMLLLLALITGFYPLLSAPSNVQQRLNYFSSMPRSLDDLVDFLSVKAALSSLLVILIAMLIGFPVLAKVTGLLSPNHYFELGGALIFFSYGASFVVLHVASDDGLDEELDEGNGDSA